ncbi:hypothetical protein ACNKCJ_003906 [Cronobacter dublinensis]|nr:hypothetical protein [Cronobacter dublinensis]
MSDSVFKIFVAFGALSLLAMQMGWIEYNAPMFFSDCVIIVVFIGIEIRQWIKKRKVK